MLHELQSLIEEFRRTFGKKPLLKAHFSPNRNVPENTIYVADVSAVNVRGPELLPIHEGISIDYRKDYAIFIHPVTLRWVRGEFHRLFPQQGLNDDEMALILAEGCLAKGAKRD